MSAYLSENSCKTPIVFALFSSVPFCWYHEIRISAVIHNKINPFVDISRNIVVSETLVRQSSN